MDDSNLTYVYSVYECSGYGLNNRCVALFSTREKAQAAADFWTAKLSLDEKAEFDSYGQISGICYQINTWSLDPQPI